MKNTMKTALFLLLALVMLLTSCTGGNEKPAETAGATEPATEAETAAPANVYTDTTLVVMTDVHLCHLSWYGKNSESRLRGMINNLNGYYDEFGYDAMLFLGDFSLDFWETGIYGSWRHQELSNTSVFLEEYASDLYCEEQYIIPGNHEQYGHELWEELTGFERQYYIKKGGYLIFMLDNFDGELDPDTDIHGIYDPTDVAFIREVMDENPDMPVLLCAHFFDLTKESDAFRDLMFDERIVALFCGHDHVTTVEDMGEDYNNKTLFHCGQYSYTNGKFTDHPWGWRTLTLTKEGITVTYYAPASDPVDGGKKLQIEAGERDRYTIPNPLAD